MSEVIKKVYDRETAHVVKMGNEYYYIDSAYTFDCGYETMVFETTIDEDGDPDDINFNDLYCEQFSDRTAMEIKHNYIIEHLEEFLCDSGTTKQ